MTTFDWIQDPAEWQSNFKVKVGIITGARVALECKQRVRPRVTNTFGSTFFFFFFLRIITNITQQGVKSHLWRPMINDANALSHSHPFAPFIHLHHRCWMFCDQSLGIHLASDLFTKKINAIPKYRQGLMENHFAPSRTGSGGGSQLALATWDEFKPVVRSNDEGRLWRARLQAKEYRNEKKNGKFSQKERGSGKDVIAQVGA